MPIYLAHLREKEDIAFYEANTRDFLFPEPKLTPAYPGVDRELLMNTHPSFPGIAPKLEFSTRTTITEIPLLSRRRYRVIREPDGQDSLSLDSSSPKAKESASCLSNNPTFCHEASFASPLRYRSPSPEGYNAMMLISRDKEE
ncbi:Spermatogenesis associated 6-like protein [Varanus komodoensis]|nr:Spermatogenesis associated 6-like protein [Varanus komodoensis]